MVAGFGGLVFFPCFGGNGQEGGFVVGRGTAFDCFFLRFCVEEVSCEDSSGRHYVALFAVWVSGGSVVDCGGGEALSGVSWLGVSG